MLKKIIFITIIISIILLNIANVSAQDNNTVELTTSVDVSNNIDTHSFTDLQNEVKNAKAKTQITISGTYKYNKKTDTSLKEGVVINKDLTITGKNDCTIDGSGLARCLRIKEGCTVTLKNIKIKNGYTTTSGAGIKIGQNSKVTIKNCIFENNIAKNSNGGAIELKESSTLKIYSSKFKNNKATRTSKLPWAKDKKGMGAAIISSINTKLNIYDSTFQSNDAYMSTILMMSLIKSGKKTSTLYITNCKFTKNKSQMNGVIYNDEYGKSTIINSIFTSNYSPKGAGTIVIESSSSSMIKNCVFSKNKGCNGAGIYVKIYKKGDACNVYVINCRFTKNTALMYGGAIYSVSGRVTVQNCQFNSNSASIFGGAIYARLGILYVSSSKFNLNKAKYAGAICSACKKANIKSSSMTNNKAYYLYGAVYNIKHNTIKNCHMKSNKVLKYSKIYLYKSGKYIMVKVTNNKDKAIEKYARLTFKGAKEVKTKWHKTSKKKYIKIRIPKSVKGAYKVTMKVKKAKYFSKTLNINI